MTDCRHILEQQLSDHPPELDVASATILYEDGDLNDLMYAASERRKATVPGNTISYLVDRNVNYTNVCTINCQFCSFYRPPGHSESYTLSYEQISQKVIELEQIGGSRILMQGGVNPELPLQWYIDLIIHLRRHHPNISLDCFSPIEIEGISDVCGLPTKEVLLSLQAVGLHGLPGGGAEMLVDEVRFSVSPKKGSSDNWIRIMREAQEIGLITSATNVYGFGESYMQRIEHMAAVRDLQKQSLEDGLLGFGSYISWPVMLENNALGSRNSGRNMNELETGVVEYLRHVSISRLFFHNIRHIQASWPTMGMDVAQMAIFAGADDLGSTMMEENVVSSSGSTKSEASESELRRVITEAGYSAVKRDSEYNIIDVSVETNIASMSS